MPRSIDLPNLATSAPLWLSLLTILVNAVVGAAHARTDDSHDWDIVGISVFALLMGLGGGFIRDTLIGNLPAESLRSPWGIVTVALGVALVLVLGRHVWRMARLIDVLDGLAMGLFAVTGAAYALAAHLPAVSAVLVGTASAVGGGVLVAVLQARVAGILVASAPSALLACLGATCFVLMAEWSPVAASFTGVAVVMAGQAVVRRRDLRTASLRLRDAR